MSQHRQIVVAINLVKQSVIELDDVLGEVPVQQIVDVLESEWARGQGWRPATNGQTYVRNFGSHLTVEFSIEQDGSIRLARRASDRVDPGVRAERQEELERELAGITEDCSVALHDVLSRALVEALPVRAGQFGDVVGVQRSSMEQEANHVYFMEVRVQLQEYVMDV